MNNTFIKGTLVLSVATLISKILGSIFRIPLQNIAGDEVLGIFSLVYPVYMVALILSVAGIPIAISKLISEARVNNDEARIIEIRQTASILALLFGVISFSLIFFFSKPIAQILGGQSVRPALIIVALTLLVAPYMAVYRGYFQGFENMVPTAISQVIEQFVRVGLILILAFVLVRQNFSDQIVAGGVMVGSSVGALASLVYLRMLYTKSLTNERYIKKTRKQGFNWKKFKKMSKIILAISIPISIGAITMALVNFVDSVTIPMSLLRADVASDQIHYLYGIYGRGLSLVQIATVFSSALVLPLIPHITKMLVEKNEAGARHITNRTHFLAHLVSWPAAFGLFALTLPLNIALFTNLAGSDVLAVIGLSSVFTSIAILGTGILQGMNLAKRAAYIVIGAVVIKVVTNIVFVQSFGLLGAAYSTLFIYILICIINTYVIMKKINFTFWSKNHTMVVLSAIIMALIIGLPTLYFPIENWGRMLSLTYSSVAIISGGFIYFILLFVFRVLKKEDVMKLPIINRLILTKKGEGK